MPRFRAAIFVVGLGGVAILAAWARRVYDAYELEVREFTVDVPGELMPRDGLGPEVLRDVSWTVSGGLVQHAWYLPPQDGALVIYVHGSPGSRSSLLPEARALAASGHGALLLDLPGFGMSQGARRWDGTHLASVAAAIDFAVAQPEVDPRRIVGFGYSMGGCVIARQAAADERLRALILRSTYTRLDVQLRHALRSPWPWVAEAPLFAARRWGVDLETMDTESALQKLRDRPVLVITGDEDTQIPVWMGERLAQAPGRGSLWIVEGGTHTNIPGLLGKAYYSRLEAFLNDATARDPAPGAPNPASTRNPE